MFFCHYTVWRSSSGFYRTN